MESERSTATAIPDAQAADLYGRYRPQIYRYCMGRLRSREDAEEWFELIYGKFQRKEGLTGISPDQVIYTAPRLGRTHGP